jgi:hypothetical protein
VIIGWTQLTENTLLSLLLLFSLGAIVNRVWNTEN